MAWAVDSCLLIDVAAKDPVFGVSSALLLERRRADALVICPISYVELSPLFNGQRLALEEFLHIVDVRWPEAWILADTYAAFDAWARYVAQKRQGNIPKRPIADMLIGAFALRFQGLLTRNSGDFRQLFPRLTIVEP